MINIFDGKTTLQDNIDVCIENNIKAKINIGKFDGVKGREFEVEMTIFLKDHELILFFNGNILSTIRYETINFKISGN